MLVWQWGRRGAGPRWAVQLAAAFNELPGVAGLLSLSSAAEILHGPEAPRCDLPVPTYASVAGLAGRVLSSPVMIVRLARRLRELKPGLAICALPGPLDWVLAIALRRAGVPFAVIVHDAVAHPGDGYPVQMVVQRRFLRAADAVVALSAHVAEQVIASGIIGRGAKLIRGVHPPMIFGTAPPVFAHDGPVRLLHFGRLLPYKGLGLLTEAIQRLESQRRWQLRVVGSGPESQALSALRAIAGVSVENRWVPEHEISSLLAWADALVLPYKEATQSGVAAAGLAAGRFVIATRVGGLAEQLAAERLGILCDPDTASLAGTIAGFIESPPPVPPAPDAKRAWRELAAHILSEIGCG